MLGLMGTAAHRRALENQSRVHRLHVQELKDQIEELRAERDSLRTQLNTRLMIERGDDLMGNRPMPPGYMTRPHEERLLTLGEWQERHQVDGFTARPEVLGG